MEIRQTTRVCWLVFQLFSVSPTQLTASNGGCVEPSWFDRDPAVVDFSHRSRPSVERAAAAGNLEAQEALKLVDRCKRSDIPTRCIPRFQAVMQVVQQLESQCAVYTYAQQVRQQQEDEQKMRNIAAMQSLLLSPAAQGLLARTSLGTSSTTSTPNRSTNVDVAATAAPTTMTTDADALLVTSDAVGASESEDSFDYDEPEDPEVVAARTAAALAPCVPPSSATPPQVDNRPWCVCTHTQQYLRLSAYRATVFSLHCSSLQLP